MNAIEKRLAKLEKELTGKNNSIGEKLYITVRDEKYLYMLEDDYLTEHHPGYRSYIRIFLPDNGRGGTDVKPYTISTE